MVSSTILSPLPALVQLISHLSSKKHYHKLFFPSDEEIKKEMLPRVVAISVENKFWTLNNLIPKPILLNTTFLRRKST